MNIKKTVKIIGGVFIFLTLPTFLLYCFIYFKYDSPVPEGIEGPKADALATKMLEELNYKAYDSTHYIEWSFKSRHHYQWDKKDNKCTVYWKNLKVNLDFEHPENNKAYMHNFKLIDQEKADAIAQATKYFNNDSFWLVAPYKVFDPGTERRLVNLENGDTGLLVTYTSGGTTPGDSYLWQFDANGKPTSFKMWTSILPIQGLEASWTDWKETETKAQLPTFHKLLILGIDIKNLKTK
ncbi:MAG: hypothetical protein BM564_03210 [Bacteroidetes bacterium MedPE-SWsnd-G2]|mgnify:CR=1 FL=1|nr:MAG: hypothetical protein BM564_03210 [Bacteroidetes bacterium MedPE-SWsnd-G2]